jgi:hypothetical protein
VAEVEHVPGRGATFRQHPAYLGLDDRPVGQQQRRVEVACTARAGPTRQEASSSGARQSTPTTSAPACPSAGSSPVPTPKCTFGTSRSASAASTAALCNC